MNFRNHFKALAQHLAQRGPSGASVWWLRESLRGIYGRLRLRREPTTPRVCDVLLIHPSEKSRRQGRKTTLLAELRGAGLIVEETVATDNKEALRQRRLRPPLYSVPLPLYLSAARAADLLANYKAKVILTERNGWPTSTFLRAFRDSDTRIIHLAHGVLSDQSSRLRYHDYDYYAVFGRSSLDYLRKGKPGFGDTLALLAGPYFPLPEKREVVPESRCLLFVGAGPEEEKTAAYRHSCDLALSWLKKHPEWKLWVRPHPRGSGQPWCNIAKTHPSIRLRPKGESLDHALSDVVAVWSGYTTAIIDCAIAGVPVLVLGRYADYFQCDLYGIPRLSSAEDLDIAMARVLTEPSLWQESLGIFARYHVENLEQPVSSLATVIIELARGGTPRNSIPSP